MQNDRVVLLSSTHREWINVIETGNPAYGRFTSVEDGALEQHPYGASLSRSNTFGEQQTYREQRSGRANGGTVNSKVVSSS